MSKEDQIRLQQERKRVWREGMEKEKLQRHRKLQDNLEEYAAHIVQKINKPSKKESKEVVNEIESNICSVCLELMIPPKYQPIILFPCGHNVCQECLLQPVHIVVELSRRKAKLVKCPICREKIESFALNRALMTLILTHNNNKESLRKEEMKELKEDVQANVEIDQLRIRCELLENEQRKIAMEASEYRKQYEILEKVVNTLQGEKERNEKEMDKLREEKKLIDKHLTVKEEEKEQLKKKIHEMNGKEKMIEKTLTPLLREKEKKQLFEVMKLVEK